ncbi:MAG: GNAT family N-acetyltransferase [Sphingobacteriales bacterium]|nr:MAG: GNAT family N-acetyltransferase [Sphingobacteriales bacterium]
MNIRSYTPADRQRCMEIFESNVPKYFTLPEREQFEFWLNWQDKGVHAYLDSIAELYYVIEDNYEIVGCGGLGVDRVHAILAWGMVDNKYHGKGYGRALLEYRLNIWSEQYSNYPMILDTSQYTYTFFEQYGFKITKITDHGYTEGLHRYDMLLGEAYPMLQTAQLLMDTITAALPSLSAISEETASLKPLSGKWSAKEIIGHLVDSACNNQQKIVRAIIDTNSSFIPYRQDEWVSVQHYNTAPWQELLLLWQSYNRHIAHIITRIPERTLNNEVTTGENTYTLQFIAADYVVHMQHHLQEILKP